jgi:hypothetical protein
MPKNINGVEHSNPRVIARSEVAWRSHEVAASEARRSQFEIASSQSFSQ